MSKGMILVDIPERCVDCSLATIPASTGIIRCMAVKKDCDAADKPEWCPIRPVPELPCNVGGTVYGVFNGEITEYTVDSIEIFEKKTTVKCHSWKPEFHGLLHKIGTYYDNDDFGKRVFLTKEEAKVKIKEIKEMEENQ